jgi:hypothetical protein
MSLPNDLVMKEARISIKLLCVGKGNKGEEDKWKELVHFQDSKEDRDWCCGTRIPKISFLEE